MITWETLTGRDLLYSNQLEVHRFHFRFWFGMSKVQSVKTMAGAEFSVN